MRPHVVLERGDIEVAGNDARRAAGIGEPVHPVVHFVEERELVGELVVDLRVGLIAACRFAMDEQQIHLALNATWTVIGDANRYFAGEAPWELRKNDPARMGTVLYVTAEVLRMVGLVIQAFMPGSARKLLDLLAVPEEGRGFASSGAAGRLKAGTLLPVPQAIFPRYVEAEEAGSEKV